MYVALAVFYVKPSNVYCSEKTRLIIRESEFRYNYRNWGIDISIIPKGQTV